MCTVTFLPYRDKIFLTSNRDEQVQRPAAFAPVIEKMSTGKILYPKDGKAGGTWIALHNNGNAMVLLNGATEKHHYKPPYKKSRGLVFLDVFDTAFPSREFLKTDLQDIEPFSLMIWDNNQLFEARWNGSDAFIEEIDHRVPHIWSSVTLYDKEVIEKREEWFNTWLAERSSMTIESILDFHRFGGEGNEQIDLRMNRNGLLKTVSITGIELTPEKSVMYYNDMLTGVESVNEWLFANS
ncbi:MAG: NRDE family protein [Flavipsychrobacter sp.]|nr:NRDE family protein [Flavipsychrobacter sp.]